MVETIRRAAYIWLLVIDIFERALYLTTEYLLNRSNMTVREKPRY